MPFDNPIINPIIERLRFGLSRIKRPHGWIKGSAFNPGGIGYPSFCAQGAVRLDDSGRSLDQPNGPDSIGLQADAYLERACELLARQAHLPVPSFNDSHVRTVEDMALVFEIAEELVLIDLTKVD